VEELACPDSPLAALLCFSAGGVNELDAAGLEGYGFTYGEGTRGIEAEILGLSVLDGVLELGIGQAAAGANGVVAAAPPVPTTAPPATDAPLPRTGVEDATPLALALGAAAALGLTIVRRTRTV
jgi:LPXTG-motif cell wall-anchored protein